MKYLLDEKNLSKQWLFWVALITPVIFSFVTGALIWGDYKLAFTPKAYAEFLSINRLPLLLLGTTIPLVAIIVYIHRTIQTEKQIKLTEIKNSADSYYSHSKHIIDNINTLPKETIIYETKNGIFFKEELSVLQPHSFYKHIFSNSSITNGFSPTINPSFYNSIHNAFNEISKALLLAENNQDDKDVLLDCLSQIESYCMILGLEYRTNYSPDSHVFSVDGMHRILNISFSNEKQLKQKLSYFYNTTISLADLFDFEADYLKFEQNNDNSLLFYIHSSFNLFDATLPTSTFADDGEKAGHMRTKSGDIMAAAAQKSS